ncbi:MAG: hypothetical protein HOQ22_05815 [Nocardioidaceae bacterium]|nr:hypothetical protein [Nocardioidaceae bacterium]
MTTDPAPPSPPTPPRSPRSGKKAASAVLTSVVLLFGLVFTPIAIVAAVNAQPLGAEWSTGSNLINVVFTWVFGVALLLLAAIAAGSALVARAAKSTGLFVYAVVVAAFVLVGAIGMLAAGAIAVSG